MKMTYSGHTSVFGEIDETYEYGCTVPGMFSFPQRIGHS